ncbi:uncharacterized protein LOC134841370 [Symsagittifera roscoffensis]|uniref:uncharacterized protein LOC134841370 n=1 Tax=Symsagittifera roscoffensis TaxID=84072 RepID=UPI00307B50DD
MEKILFRCICIFLMFIRSSEGEGEVPYCKEARKCLCMILKVQCLHVTADDPDIDKLTSNFEAIIAAQSVLQFRTVNPYITEIQIETSEYSFLTNEPAFPNLRVFNLVSSTYRGFPKNNITELRIKQSGNLQGKGLLRVLKNLSHEFPKLEKLELVNMLLTFDERDTTAEPIKFDNLKNLVLTGNSISSLLVLNSIEGWWRMKEINFANNSITTITLGDIKQIAGFEFEPDASVKLQMGQQRSIYCVCGLNDFQRWLKATELFTNPSSIRCKLQTGRFNAPTDSLLNVHNLCQKSRQSTAVALHGVGKLKGSVAALIVTGSVVGIIAICVISCHHHRIGKTARSMRQMRNTPPYQR